MPDNETATLYGISELETVEILTTPFDVLVETTVKTEEERLLSFQEKAKQIAKKEMDQLKSSLESWLNANVRYNAESLLRLEKAKQATEATLNKLYEESPGELELYKIELERATREIRRLQSQYEDVCTLIDPLDDNMPAKFWRRWASGISKTINEIDNWLEDTEGKDLPKDVKAAIKKIKDINDMNGDFRDNISVHADELEENARLLKLNQKKNAQRDF